MVILKNKRGWLRILEAFLTILLIAGVFLLVVSSNSFIGDDSDEINNQQQKILREIQLNHSLRQIVLDIDSQVLPVNWDDFPQLVKDKFNEKIPPSLNCSAMICSLSNLCVDNSTPEENVYVKGIIISSTIDTYNPRKINLFCWRK